MLLNRIKFSKEREFLLHSVDNISLTSLLNFHTICFFYLRNKYYIVSLRFPPLFSPAWLKVKLFIQMKTSRRNASILAELLISENHNLMKNPLSHQLWIYSSQKKKKYRCISQMRLGSVFKMRVSILEAQRLQATGICVFFFRLH